MYLEFFGDVSIYFGIGVQIVFALILGGAIGYDREVKMKSAGLKTIIMICVGATLYTTISLLNVVHATSVFDPNRVTAQVVSGIGFLGAGAIMHGKGNISGLTTAATIWVVAAIGVTIGVGYPIVASIFTFTVIIILKMINPLYRVLEREGDYKDFHIQVLTSQSIKKLIAKVVTTQPNVQIEEIYEMDHLEKKEKKIINIFLKGHKRSVERIINELRNMISVEKSTYREVQNNDDFIDIYAKMDNSRKKDS
tara:strand:- start:771 stop:1526 length:756 start_codon:yes stop_codon:yes gene_type:complete